MSLIKELNDKLKPADPVEEAIKSLSEATDEMHQLHDDQIETLADYMKEMMDDAKVRGTLMDIKDAAGMALEDVAGFETAPQRVIKAIVARLMRAYIKKYGE